MLTYTLSQVNLGARVTTLCSCELELIGAHASWIVLCEIAESYTHIVQTSAYARRAFELTKALNFVADFEFASVRALRMLVA